MARWVSLVLGIVLLVICNAVTDFFRPPPRLAPCPVVALADVARDDIENGYTCVSVMAVTVARVDDAGVTPVRSIVMLQDGTTRIGAIWPGPDAPPVDSVINATGVVARLGSVWGLALVSWEPKR